ncbi:MAG: hypothetical protein GC180_02910 [Bacteroidetes bacterium]|nr:hypothetical protein [Bacteroidota bacterium]
MKTNLLIFLTLFLFSCQQNKIAYQDHSVSSVIGDESFIKTFGFQPNDAVNCKLRVQTHLEYVEKLLRAKDISHLSPELKKRRLVSLDALKEYARAGVFPHNNDYPNVYRPCFIDDEGRICAVGYLVEQSAGREMAETINEQAQYELIENIHLVELDHWIDQSGFRKEELAMIQPQYYTGPPVGPAKEVVNLGYGMSSILFTLSNSTLIGVNMYQLKHQNQFHSKRMIWIGLGLGLGQSAMGILCMPSTHQDRVTFPKSTSISWANIGIGAASMLTSGANMLSNKSFSKNQMTLFLSTPRVNSKCTAFGIGLIKTL